MASRTIQFPRTHFARPLPAPLSNSLYLVERPTPAPILDTLAHARAIVAQVEAEMAQQAGRSSSLLIFPTLPARARTQYETPFAVARRVWNSLMAS